MKQDWEIYRDTVCAFGLASAAPRSPYRHLELCGIALGFIVLPQKFKTRRKPHL